MGTEVDLKTIVAGAEVESHLPAGDSLVRLVEAALSNPDDLPEARNRLIDELDHAALVDAAGVIGNFQKMTRIADSTGIPVDSAAAAMSADIREELGLDEFSSARVGS